MPAPSQRGSRNGRIKIVDKDKIQERVIEIVCENLGVNKEQVTRSTSFRRTSAPIRSTSSSW